MISFVIRLAFNSQILNEFHIFKDFSKFSSKLATIVVRLKSNIYFSIIVQTPPQSLAGGFFIKSLHLFANTLLGASPKLHNLLNISSASEKSDLKYNCKAFSNSQIFQITSHDTSSCLQTNSYIFTATSLPLTLILSKNLNSYFSFALLYIVSLAHIKVQ
jgi:hypothetical protein